MQPRHEGVIAPCTRLTLPTFPPHADLCSLEFNVSDENTLAQLYNTSKTPDTSHAIVNALHGI